MRDTAALGLVLAAAALLCADDERPASADDWSARQSQKWTHRQLESSHDPDNESNPTDVKSLVTLAYTRARTARSVEEYDSVLDICRNAKTKATSEPLATYVAKLTSWARNRRGEVKADLAADADQTGDRQRAETLAAEALDDFEQAVRLNPESWRPRHNRGVSYAAAGRFDEALEEFNWTIAHNPRYANAWFNRGEIHCEMGRYRQAASDYTESLRIHPEDAEVYAARGVARFHVGEVEESLRDFDRAVRYANGDANVYVDRAELLVVMGQWQRAAEDYREAIRLDETLSRAYCGAAWLMAACPDPRIRDPELALQAARRGIRLRGEDDARYLDTLAAAEAAAGQFDQARKTLVKAMELAPVKFLPELRRRLALYEKDQPFVLKSGAKTESSSLWR